MFCAIFVAARISWRILLGKRILITGSEGLIGLVVRAELAALGFSVKGLDLRGAGTEHGDVRDPAQVARAIALCDGILHLAAVSRVVWGERDPHLCWTTNVGGLQNVLDAAAKQKRPPWIIFASSREVYGQPVHFPATEDAELSPMNVYARSKVEGERMVWDARERGMRTSIIRLSNVFGRTSDHADRVVPAFAKAAVSGLPLRVDGGTNTFDFTHVDDVSSGIVALVQRMSSGAAETPPIQFVSGVATTLEELAELALELAQSKSVVVRAPSRNFDVARFYGSPQRALAVLDWAPRVPLREGLARLIADFENEVLLPSNNLSAA